MLATQVESGLLLDAKGSLKICIAAVMPSSLIYAEEFFHLLENGDVDEEVVLRNVFCFRQKVKHSREQVSRKDRRSIKLAFK